MTVDQSFEALHRARIRGLAPVEDMTDVDDLVEASLLLVTERGCMLTPAGLERHEQLLVAWRDAVDLDVVATAYERFLAVNQPMKDTCAGWQTGSADAEALFVTVDALSGIVQRVKPALRRAAQAVPRFATYTPRLLAALDAAAAGDGRFITDPRVDSLHSIWFECHEDFLVTLGRDREQEGSF
jgi:hypothetical protein